MSDGGWGVENDRLRHLEQHGSSGKASGSGAWAALGASGESWVRGARAWAFVGSLASRAIDCGDDSVPGEAEFSRQSGLFGGNAYWSGGPLVGSDGLVSIHCDVAKDGLGYGVGFGGLFILGVCKGHEVPS